jgi:hypothetical protein
MVNRGTSRRTPAKLHTNPRKEKIAEYFVFIMLLDLDAATT